ncbi:MAG TPA: pilin [Candidatus Fimivivens sp.]|nr:pilin [Candidatus Fimivivens sp.]
MKSIKQIGYGAAVFVLAAPAFVLAQATGYGTVPGSGTSYSSVATTGGLTQNSIGAILTTVMNWVLGILGVGAIISFVIAGILYLTAAGDESKTEKAKNLMTYAIIAIIVALVGWVVINTVVSLLGARSSGQQY